MKIKNSMRNEDRIATQIVHSGHLFFITAWWSIIADFNILHIKNQVNFIKNSEITDCKVPSTLSYLWYKTNKQKDHAEIIQRQGEKLIFRQLFCYCFVVLGQHSYFQGLHLARCLGIMTGDAGDQSGVSLTQGKLLSTVLFIQPCSRVFNGKNSSNTNTYEMSWFFYSKF